MVKFRGKGGGQEELEVGDGLLHGHIKGTHQRPPLIQHFRSGIFWEIPENKETIEYTQTWLYSLALFKRVENQLLICHQCLL